MKRGLLLYLFFIMTAAQTLTAQNTPTPLTNTEKSEVIGSISRLLTDNYVFPKVAEEMSRFITKNLEAGKYSSYNDPMSFGDKLTEDLQSVSHDKHLRVSFAPKQIAEMKPHVKNANDDDRIPEAWLRQMKSNNFGFKEVKVLKGNNKVVGLQGLHQDGHTDQSLKDKSTP